MIINIVYGFLGAGKTTFIKRILENPPEHEKLVVLVNEFGDVGIDRRIMEMHGSSAADIVEMESGCVCCTMVSDFRSQLIELHDRYLPHRMIIEPSGVAVISQLLNIFKRDDIRVLFSDLRLVNIMDSSEFLRFFKSSRNFLENQIRAAHIVILNKTDRLKPRMADLLSSSVKEINPGADVFLTSFCEFEPASLMALLGDRKTETLLKTAQITPFFQDILSNATGSFESFARTYYDKVFNMLCLESFFKNLADRQYGEVSRAKGIFKTPDTWILMELASGQIHYETHYETVPGCTESVISIIGIKLNSEKLDINLKNCLGL